MPKRYNEIKWVVALVLVIAGVTYCQASGPDDEFDSHDQLNRVLLYVPQTGPNNFNTENTTTGAPPANNGFYYPLGPSNFPPPVLELNDQVVQETDTTVLTVFIKQYDTGNSTDQILQPPFQHPMTTSEAHKILQGIATKYKGTGDLSGVAKALYDFNEEYKARNNEEWFNWAGSKEGKYVNGIVDNTDPETYLYAQDLACYEFVDFCAWIASDRPTHYAQTRPLQPGEVPPPGVTPHEGGLPDGSIGLVIPVGTPQVYWGPTIGCFTNASGDAWANPGAVQPGQLVVGVGGDIVSSNNTFGYNHVAIAIGNGQVIGLGSNGLSKNDIVNKWGLGGMFWKVSYSKAFIADYKWSPTNPAPAALTNGSGGGANNNPAPSGGNNAPPANPENPTATGTGNNAPPANTGNPAGAGNNATPSTPNQVQPAPGNNPVPTGSNK